jgi:hypothetical protein
MSTGTSTDVNPIESEWTLWRYGKQQEAIAAFRHRLHLSLMEAAERFKDFMETHIIPGGECDRCGKELARQVFGVTGKNDKRGFPVHDYYAPGPEPHDRDDCIRYLAQLLSDIKSQFRAFGEDT